MAIFKRVRDIISARLNDLLDGIEDPEAMINQMIREMEASIIDLRRNAASAIAAQKMVERRLARLTEEDAEWQQNAELAVRKGEDDLARKALARKADLAGPVAELRGQIADGDVLVARLKDELKSVEDKVQEARAKRETLVTKKRLAESRQKMLDAAGRAGTGTPADPGAARRIIQGFDRLEEEIERKAAEAEAADELDRESRGDDVLGDFDRMKRERDVDEELDALKKKLGKKDGDSGGA